MYYVYVCIKFVITTSIGSLMRHCSENVVGGLDLPEKFDALTVNNDAVCVPLPLNMSNAKICKILMAQVIENSPLLPLY